MDSRAKDVENLLSNPKRALLTMSLPLLLALIVENLQTFIDGVWCSGLEAEAMSAISISHPIYGMIACIGTGIGVGVSAAAAKYIGKGDKDSAENIVAGSVRVVFAVSIAAAAAMWFLAEPIIVFCSGEEALGLSMEYTRPFLVCSFFLMMNAVWAGLLRSEGAARKSMMLSVIASLTNMVLDPILIYGLGLGVLGASLATCISFIAITAIAFWWYLSGRTYLSMRLRGYRFRRDPMKEVMAIAVPCIFEMLVQPLIGVPQNAIVYSCGGEEGFVAYTYAFRFIAIALIPTIAIGKSLIPVISAAIGQDDSKKIVDSCRLAYRYTLSMELVFMIAIFLSADLLVNAFMNSESMLPIHDEMALALRIYTLTCIFHTFRIVGTSILQASRHAVVASVLTLVREFMFLGTFAIAATVSMHAIYWACDLTNFAMMFLITGFAYHYLKKLVRDVDAHKGMHKEGGSAVRRPPADPPRPFTLSLMRSSISLDGILRTIMSSGTGSA